MTQRPFRLHTIISGGQTGADVTALEEARALHLHTGGTAPKGWRTEHGANPALADFGLVQSSSPRYIPRTRANVRHADVTVWFGRTNTPGFRCTLRACHDYDKPLIVNPISFASIARHAGTINVAGNRASANPDVVALVRAAFAELRVYGF